MAALNEIETKSINFLSVGNYAFLNQNLIKLSKDLNDEEQAWNVTRDPVIETIEPFGDQIKVVTRNSVLFFDVHDLLSLKDKIEGQSKAINIPSAPPPAVVVDCSTFKVLHKSVKLLKDYKSNPINGSVPDGVPLVLPNEVPDDFDYALDFGWDSPMTVIGSSVWTTTDNKNVAFVALGVELPGEDAFNTLILFGDVDKDGMFDIKGHSFNDLMIESKKATCSALQIVAIDTLILSTSEYDSSILVSYGQEDLWGYPHKPSFNTDCVNRILPRNMLSAFQGDNNETSYISKIIGFSRSYWPDSMPEGVVRKEENDDEKLTTGPTDIIVMHQPDDIISIKAVDYGVKIKEMVKETADSIVKTQQTVIVPPKAMSATIITPNAKDNFPILGQKKTELENIHQRSLLNNDKRTDYYRIDTPSARAKSGDRDSVSHCPSTGKRRDHSKIITRNDVHGTKEDRKHELEMLLRIDRACIRPTHRALDFTEDMIVSLTKKSRLNRLENLKNQAKILRMDIQGGVETFQQTNDVIKDIKTNVKSMASYNEPSRKFLDDAKEYLKGHDGSSPPARKPSALFRNLICPSAHVSSETLQRREELLSLQNRLKEALTTISRAMRSYECRTKRLLTTDSDGTTRFDDSFIDSLLHEENSKRGLKKNSNNYGGLNEVWPPVQDDHAQIFQQALTVLRSSNWKSALDSNLSTSINNYNPRLTEIIDNNDVDEAITTSASRMMNDLVHLNSYIEALTYEVMTLQDRIAEVRTELHLDNCDRRNPVG